MPKNHTAVNRTTPLKNLAHKANMTVNALDSNYLGLTAIVTTLYQTLFFIITYVFKFDKVTDFAGGTNFAILALLTFFLNQTYHPRQIVLTCLVTIWSLRLSGFLLYRILQWGEDHRFDEKRGKLLPLLTFWFFQALWVFTVSLPLTFINSNDSTRSIGFRDIFGWVLWAVGFVIECMADQQKLRFKQDQQNKGKCCMVGWWKWSRHPNYFSEIILWWGIYISATRNLRGGQHAAVIGPLFITAILLFLSGLPLLEKSGDKKYGEQEEYVRYKRGTSILVPLPPGVYQRIPEVVRKTVLLDLPMYDHLDGEKKSLIGKKENKGTTGQSESVA